MIADYLIIRSKSFLTGRKLHFRWRMDFFSLIRTLFSSAVGQSILRRKWRYLLYGRYYITIFT